MLPVWKTCRCGAALPVGPELKFPEHAVGDAPEWWGDARCGLSGLPVRRRAAKPKEWWQVVASRARSIEPKKKWNPDR
jgi:hypothetical protein